MVAESGNRMFRIPVFMMVILAGLGFAALNLRTGFKGDVLGLGLLRTTGSSALDSFDNPRQVQEVSPEKKSASTPLSEAEGNQENKPKAEERKIDPPEKTSEKTPNPPETTPPTQEPQNDQVKKEDFKPMNIILLYGDDWRHDSIGSAKASIVQTPFFDWLADQGMKFVRNCVTTSVCWISRANLYTGQYVCRHNSTYPHKPDWYVFWDKAWPKMLKDAGYYLGHVGKWHFEWNSMVSGTWDFGRPYYGQHWYNDRGGRIHTTKKNEKDALEFLKERPRKKPFMLSVCFFAPHSVDGTDDQYFPQNESMSLYVNDTVDVPISATEEEWNKLPSFFGDINEGRRRWRIRFDTPEKHQRMMKNYYRLVTEIDATSKAIYEELERQGEADNTMIIFTTDNGLFHSEHQLAGKWFPHEESIRVPLIIKDPRMPKTKVGTVNDEFTLNIDLASTILGAAKLPQSDLMQGRDISDLYLTEDPQWRQEFFYEHPVHLESRIIPASTALVRKGMKFMNWPDYKVDQLFNLTEDPLEMNDLVKREEMESVLGEMKIRHNELKLAALEPGPIDESGERMRGVFQEDANTDKKPSR
eukprot:CAMPEP_0202455956 /NCGR_PEP_ID=MMETSP1360-20130828/13344_1 /ASSEMBLY_ACC=CAM_ASM_000848 /TAXON_ID=515479 /ORGANISM="Licmophora paradoxa, Strain CCMP2313" /LENGTH=584 /DNA_ID=CAMNT_0049075651 /DNA_START=26 /DNA_END=1780 /DNA_ORIENTATION=-